MKRKQVLALLLAVCLSSSLLPVPILATEGAAEPVQAVAEEGTGTLRQWCEIRIRPGDGTGRRERIARTDGRVNRARSSGRGRSGAD